MGAQHAVAALDRILARHGEPVTFQRDDFNTGNVFIPTMAFVRGFDPTELVAGIDVSSSHVTLSPTDFAASGILPTKGDYILVAGKSRYVDVAEIRRIGVTSVRFELRVTGR